MKIKELLKNKKVMIASAVVLLIAVVVIIVARRKKKSETVDGASEDSTSQGGSNCLTGALLDPVLKYPKASFPLTPYNRAGEYSAEAGSYGQQIAILQKICNEKFGKNLDVDGKFGPKSENAFMSCFGSPFAPPYSEEVYNGFLVKSGYGLLY